MRISDNDSSGPVYEDFRQLLALSQGRVSRNPSRLGRLRIRVNKGLERVAALLETRVALSVGGCVFVALVGISWLSIDQRERVQSPVADTADHEEAATPSGQTENSTSFYPVSLDTTVHAASPNALDEAFLVRVGSFRDPFNAARLRRALLEQTSDVRTSTLPGGLYVVELGPFSKRDAAERTAQSLRQGSGLTPEVVRQR